MNLGSLDNIDMEWTQEDINEQVTLQRVIDEQRMIMDKNALPLMQIQMPVKNKDEGSQTSTTTSTTTTVTAQPDPALVVQPHPDLPDVPADHVVVENVVPNVPPSSGGDGSH